MAVLLSSVFHEVRLGTADAEPLSRSSRLGHAALWRNSRKEGLPFYAEEGAVLYSTVL